jgi:hypothetical protein
MTLGLTMVLGGLMFVVDEIVDTLTWYFSTRTSRWSCSFALVTSNRASSPTPSRH